MDAKSQYVRLLTSFVPVAIESEGENDRALSVAEALMQKPRRTAAESSMLKLLAVLIENFEQQQYPLGEASPVETLKELIAARGITQKDLLPVFGSRGIVSEVLSGKRGISKAVARRLAEHFGVSVALFI